MKMSRAGKNKVENDIEIDLQRSSTAASAS